MQEIDNMYTSTPTCMYMHAYMCVHVCLRTYMYMYMCRHMYVYHDIIGQLPEHDQHGKVFYHNRSPRTDIMGGQLYHFLCES